MVRTRIWILGTLLWACSGGGKDEGDEGDPGADGGVIDEGDGGTGDPTDPGEGPRATGPFARACEAAEASPSRAPIRRLSPAEYRRSVAELFAPLQLPEVNLIADATVGGFDKLADGQVVSPLGIEGFRYAAESLAAHTSQDLAWAPCDGTSDAAGCIAQIVDRLGEGAYRHALSDAERTRLVTLGQAAVTDYGFPVAVRMLVEGVLQSPWFLYRPEFGDPAREAPEGLVALSGEEIATRLAFLFRGAGPDADLKAAAAAGELDTPEGIEAEALRMLSTEAGMANVVELFSQWFRVDRLLAASLDRALYPEFTAEVQADLAESIRLFFEHAFEQEDGLSALFTAPQGYVNGNIAPFFEVPAADVSDALELIDLNPEQRAGILTHPGILASTSHARTHAPILRGVFVLESMLCIKPPPPSSDINIAAATEPSTTARTTRQHIEETHVVNACRSCHAAIDGIGFSFENYNAVGKFVTEENGEPVDSTGQLPIGTDIEGEVEGAVELSAALARSDQVKDCIAAHWYRYTLGRVESADSDRCQVRELGVGLAENGGNFRDMLLRLLRSDSFRYLPAID